jgi:hypothetical protein
VLIDVPAISPETNKTVSAPSRRTDKATTMASAHSV